ncbi:hypothetical protein ACFWN2_04545 [Lentzea sp. NPDC058436]|uniref:hypothetical protein n=1 Tax=Lentzea sp. NPDC058436 TaxID=3346499 RepID=UPI0036691365
MARPWVRFSLPILVGGLAIAALLFGYQTFKQGSPRGLPEVDGGQLALLTTDVDVQVSLTMDLTLDFHPGQAWPVNLEIVINRKESGPFRWAVLLARDIALPYSVDDPSGDARPRGGQRAFNDVWVQGDVGQAWYLRNARADRPGEPGTRFPNMLGSALVGEQWRSGPTEGRRTISQTAAARNRPGDLHQLPRPRSTRQRSAI